MPGFPEYTKYDGLGLAELVRAKQVSPLELVEEAITRIEKVNPRLNAVVHTLYDDARRAAKKGSGEGVFAGVPFLVKDLLSDYAGEATVGGAAIFKGVKAARDS